MVCRYWSAGVVSRAGFAYKDRVALGVWGCLSGGFFRADDGGLRVILDADRIGDDADKYGALVGDPSDLYSARRIRFSSRSVCGRFGSCWDRFLVSRSVTRSGFQVIFATRSLWCTLRHDSVQAGL